MLQLKFKSHFFPLSGMHTNPEQVIGDYHNSLIHIHSHLPMKPTFATALLSLHVDTDGKAWQSPMWIAWLGLDVDLMQSQQIREREAMEHLSTHLKGFGTFQDQQQLIMSKSKTSNGQTWILDPSLTEGTQAWISLTNHLFEKYNFRDLIGRASVAFIPYFKV